MNIKTISGLLFAVIITLNISCVKEDFDAPPPYEGPDIETNATIEDLHRLHEQGKFVTIEEDLIVNAIVVADDSSGNYYKRLVIQDDDPAVDRGIELSINAVNLFNTYPIGREIFIRCQGLILSDFNGLIQLGGNTYIDDDGDLRLGGIEETLIDQYIIKGNVNQDIEPEVTTINDLDITSDQSTLVTLNNVQFVASDTSLLFTDGFATTNRTLENCDGDQIVIRTSNFADFSINNIPNGKGNVTGVFSSFGTTKQLYIRRISDVDLDQSRCQISVDGTPISIGDLRSTFPIVPDDKYITGVAISDRTTGNINGQNVVIEGDDKYGILVRFRDNHTINLGDQVIVKTDGAELSEFNGLMQLNDVPLSSLVNNGPGQQPEPHDITIEEILNDFERYESTLVKVDGASITKSGGNTFEFVTTIDDETATIDMFTSPGADFASASLPDSEVDMTAIVSQGGNESSMQLSIRSLDDLDGYSGGGGGGNDEEELPYSTEFNSGIPSNWTVVNTTGDREWQGRDFDDVFYAQMSAFNQGDIVDVETWMITPLFDFDAQSGEYIQFKMADAFENGNPLRLVYSTDYSGSGNPSSANWTEIGSSEIANLINNPDGYDNIYEDSGQIDLSMITGKAHLAFVYDSQNATVSTTVQISEVNVE